MMFLKGQNYKRKGEGRAVGFFKIGKRESGH